MIANMLASNSMVMVEVRCLYIKQDVDLREIKKKFDKRFMLIIGGCNFKT